MGRRAAELAAHRTLRDVTPAAPSARELAALAGPRFGRRHAALLAAWATYDALVRRVDAPAVRAAVEQHGFAITEAGALFELLVLFRVRAVLHDAGWAVDRARLVEGAVRFVAVRGERRLTVWFQGVPGELSAASAYRAAQHTHGFGRVNDLRPDLVLGLETVGGGPTRWVVVEAKTATTERPVPELARRALLDLLAYRSAYAVHLAPQFMWGLGVVWGYELITSAGPG